ncbi:uncharacterized protein LOC134234860 [Saccostrea cucullata]|uniref:uncharacterized protein LOC134234860 n=1 Tax=Saccostrea cuccullata TaxID=36930 RepID=UPI002ED47C47
MPHQEKITLPAGMKKTEVWKIMASDLDSQSLTKSSFLKIWKRSFPHITVVKENPFSKCHICTTLHFEFEKCGRYERDAKMIVLERKKQHWDYVRRQKEAYYERREVSRLFPRKCLTIIMDGMDQKKTNIPILFSKSRNSKQIGNLQQVRTHLLGFLVHRDSEVSGARKVGYGYFDLLQYPHDSNLNLTVLLQTLLDYKDCLGRELHLQTDSASDNKNKIVLGFLGIMVHLGIFEECYLHMLPVGHTHEDIDAMFSNFSSLLKADIMTLEELTRTFQKLSYIKESKIVKEVWDFKDWMVHHLVNNHGLGDQFEFRIHTLDKESRTPIFHYRRGEGERWLPDCEDENSFEHQQDKCGIQIFKDMDFLRTKPKYVVPTEKAMYLNRILQETCPKLLECGLLKDEERQWWEEFSSTAREKFLTPPINVTFPLEDLIPVRSPSESSEPPDSIQLMERTLQELVDRTKRKSLVYTGRYLHQKKRKTAG